MIPIFIFTLLNGAAVSVELEILSQVGAGDFGAGYES